MSDKPRAYTRDEMREMFIAHLRAIANHWADETRAATAKEKCEGVAFSILVMLDGGSGSMPSFDVTPRPHPDDKEFHRANGDNWWEPEEIGVALHEQFYRKE